eukprot:scaffold2026_cov78-Cylindrotheca_fusiformis.AAC.1
MFESVQQSAVELFSREVGRIIPFQVLTGVSARIGRNLNKVVCTPQEDLQGSNADSRPKSSSWHAFAFRSVWQAVFGLQWKCRAAKGASLSAYGTILHAWLRKLHRDEIHFVLTLVE